MSELRFYEKNVYGNDLIYPVKEIAGQVSELTGKKTVSMSQLKALKALGFEVVLSKADFQTVFI